MRMWGRRDWNAVGFDFVTQRIAVDDVVVVDQPGIDVDKIGHKAGHTALQNGTIAADDVLQVDVRLISLMHHCRHTIISM